MIFNTIKLPLVLFLIYGTVACGSSSGSASDGTRVVIRATPTPANSIAQNAGIKTFSNDLGDSITLNKAYLVLSSATIESACGPTFSAVLESIFTWIIPAAQAHTTTTPTSTGVPFVFDLLGADSIPIVIGELSPPQQNYCGLRIDMLAADDDAINLPNGIADPDMIGKSIFIEGSFALAGGGNGNIHISSTATLTNRDLLLSTVLEISADNPDDGVDIEINYDTWFNAVDLALLETETASFTNPSDINVNRVLQNVIESIH